VAELEKAIQALTERMNTLASPEHVEGGEEREASEERVESGKIEGRTEARAPGTPGIRSLDDAARIAADEAGAPSGKGTQAGEGGVQDEGSEDGGPEIERDEEMEPPQAARPAEEQEPEQPEGEQPEDRKEAAPPERSEIRRPARAPDHRASGKKHDEEAGERVEEPDTWEPEPVAMGAEAGESDTETEAEEPEARAESDESETGAEAEEPEAGAESEAGAEAGESEEAGPVEAEAGEAAQGSVLFDGSARSAQAWQTVGSAETGLRNRELHIKGGPERGLVYYKARQFDDCRLRVEYKVDSGDSPAGVALRFLNPDRPVADPENPEMHYQYDNKAYVAAHTGFEIYLGEGGGREAGTIAGIRIGDGGGVQFHGESVQVRTDDWNELEVEVRGDEYLVRLNGAETCRFTNTDEWRGKPASEGGGYVGILTGKARGAERGKATDETRAEPAATPHRRGARASPLSGPMVPRRASPQRAQPPDGGRGAAASEPLQDVQVHIRHIELLPLSARATARPQARARTARQTEQEPGKQPVKADLQKVEKRGEREEREEPEKKEEEKPVKKLSPTDVKALHSEVVAALTRIEGKYPATKSVLRKAYGYAVFPSIGRAGLLVGGARGYGEVYEQGRLIGYARVTQLTLGVHVGGQTFSEIVEFASEPALRVFKGSPLEFDANASAAFIRGATGTTDFKDVRARAYSRGGMILEASLGGQKFRFYPKENVLARDEDEGAQPEGGGRQESSDRQESEPQRESGPERRTRIERPASPQLPGDARPVSKAMGDVGRATKGLFKAFASRMHRGGEKHADRGAE
jgi:hypothetical protein